MNLKQHSNLFLFVSFYKQRSHAEDLILQLESFISTVEEKYFLSSFLS